MAGHDGGRIGTFGPWYKFQSPLDAIRPIVDTVQAHAALGTKFRVVAFHMRHDTLDCAQPRQAATGATG
jgi:hypothetical protein